MALDIAGEDGLGCRIYLPCANLYELYEIDQVYCRSIVRGMMT
jgi:hypothetical protein